MKKTLFILLITLFTLSYKNSVAQQTNVAEKIGWKSFSINTKDMGVINYYITNNKIDTKKPILLYLDGSGPYPLYQYSTRGIGSTVPIDYKNLSEKYHVVLISKPGIPFIDSVYRDLKTGSLIYKTPDEYKKRLSLEWRVNAANMVLKELLAKPTTDKNKVAVMGISEGFQVGSKLLTINKSITHAALIIGNGLNQLFDFIIQNRTDAQIGKISSEQAQKNIDSLNTIFKDIYAHPTSTDKEWYGHTYLRWASFSHNIPLENLLSTTIPVYIIAASNDQNTTAISTDYISLESIRKGKKNITYKVYPYDHSLNEFTKDENGNVISVKNHTQEVISDVINWFNSNQINP